MPAVVAMPSQSRADQQQHARARQTDERPPQQEDDGLLSVGTVRSIGECLGRRRALRGGGASKRGD